VLLVFYEDGIAPALTPWEGRHAFALSAEEVKAAYSKYKSERPDLIMHDGGGEPLALRDKLGTLFIFIARDADGYELCFASREILLPAVVEAVTNYDGSALDWGSRDERIEEIVAAGQEVEAIIKQHPVVLFSKEWCPFCKKAKAALSSIDATFFAKELEDKKKAPLVASPKAFQDYLAAKTNVGRSVPKAFIGGSFVGGGDDVVAMMKSGQLLTKCVAVGAANDLSAQASTSATHYFANGTLVTLEEWTRNQL
jgi:glutaredoxin 3